MCDFFQMGGGVLFLSVQTQIFLHCYTGFVHSFISPQLHVLLLKNELYRERRVEGQFF